MTGLLWLVLANAAVLLASRKLLSRFGTGLPATDAALFLLFRFLIISAAVLAAGALHLFRPWVLGIAGGVAAVILILRGTHREFLPWWKPVNGPALYILLAAALRLLLQAWFLSPFLGDVTSYHLPKVAEWVIHGSLFTDLGPDKRAWFPAGFELIEAWWVVFLHHDVLIEMAGIEFLALGAAATMAIASRLGLNRDASLLAGAIYATVPGMMVVSVFGLNDAAVAAMVVATAALVLDRAHPALILSAVALGTGIKPTTAFALPGLVLLWAWRRKEERSEEPSRAGRAIWSLAAVALIVGSVWYARNTVLFGNPIYPVGTSAFDYGAQQQLEHPGPGWAKLRANLSDLFEGSILDGRRAVNGMLQHAAGWGVVAFGVGLIGILAACRTSTRWRIVAGAFLLSGVSVLALADNDPWVFRFVLFFPALLSIGAASLATEVRGLLLPVLLLSGLNLVGTVFTDDAPRAAIVRASQMSWRERTFAETWIPEAPYRRVGCYGDLSTMSYLLYRPDLSREVVYLRPSSPSDLADLMERFDLAALYAMSLRDRNGWGALLTECVRSGRLKHVRGPWYELVRR